LHLSLALLYHLLNHSLSLSPNSPESSLATIIHPTDPLFLSGTISSESKHLVSPEPQPLRRLFHPSNHSG
jgi:hypothetical protein